MSSVALADGSGRELEPLPPQKAAEMYVDHRRNELREQTLSAHFYRLKQFWEWCEREGLSNLNELTGRDLHRYRAFRLNELGLEPTTVRGDLFTLKKFLEFCESIEAVQDGLSERVDIPQVSPAERASDVTISVNRAEAILDYYRKFEYAGRSHAMLELVWNVGMRLGALRGLDLDDVHVEADDPFIELVHRPETGTPLKNGASGERPVLISRDVKLVLEDYIDVNRRDVRDEHDREPLFTTRHGRISGSAIRETFYRATRPCLYTECPHDRVPETCEAMEPGRASLCPSSRGPHAIRSGAITRMRAAGVPPEIISERVNATEKIIEQHYDRTTARERMGLRKRHLESILE